MSYSPGYGASPSAGSPRSAFAGGGSALPSGSGLALTSSLLASPRFARRAARASPSSVTNALGASSGIYSSSPAGRRAELDRLVAAASPSAPSPTLARQRTALAQDVASLTADLDKLQRRTASRDVDLAARASVSQALLHREAAQVVTLEHQLAQAEQHKEAALQTYAQEIDSLRSSMTRAA